MYRNMHNQKLNLEQTYTSDNSLSKPHPSIHQTPSPLMPHKHQNNCLHNPSPTTFRILIISMGPHTQTLINQIEMVQRRAARFCLNDYTLREAGCVSEILNQLHLQQLITRRTNRRLTILHKAIYGHLSLPVNNLLQPVQRLSRHLNNKAFSPIHASKNCYKYSYFPGTIGDGNSLPDAIVNIPKPQHFKQALIHD